jgi:hypothetical protein
MRLIGARLAGLPGQHRNCINGTLTKGEGVCTENQPDDPPWGKLRSLGGSESEDWSAHLATDEPAHYFAVPPSVVTGPATASPKPIRTARSGSAHQGLDRWNHSRLSARSARRATSVPSHGASDGHRMHDQWWRMGSFLIFAMSPLRKKAARCEFGEKMTNNQWSLLIAATQAPKYTIRVCNGMTADQHTKSECEIDLLADIAGREEAIGGSRDVSFDLWLLGQVYRCLNVPEPDNAGERLTVFRTAVAAMIGIRPGDEIEGMIAAQIVATHIATMACHQRASQVDQTFEGWRECLNQASKLSRSYAALVEALHRHRNKGQ